MAFNTSTTAKVGLAVARFLTRGSRPDFGFSPEAYRNKEIYVSSFLLTQEQLLASLQRVTKTAPEDWQITTRDVKEYIGEGTALMQQGEYLRGLFQVLFGCLYSPGFGGNYEEMLGNKALGLPQEDLDEEVRKAVEALASTLLLDSRP